MPLSFRERSRSTISIALVVFTLFSSARAHAQANHKLAPVGGRTTLVGGTGLVYGRDSASVFLNPATIVRIDPGRLAFSVNFYSLSLLSLPSWYQPGSVDARFGNIPKDKASISSFDFDPLPGSLCLFLRAHDIPFLSRENARETQARLGFCISTVQSSFYGLSDESYAQKTSYGMTRQAGTMRQTMRRFAVGPSYAMYVDDHLAVGASVQLSRASFRSYISNTTTTSVGDDQMVNSALLATGHGDSHEIKFSIGATYRRGHQTTALSIDSPSLHLFGSGGTNAYTNYDGTGGAVYNRAADGKFAINTPLRIAVGTGYESSIGSAELNVSFNAPLGKAYEASFTGNTYSSTGGVATDTPASLNFSARSRGAVNIGLGGELFLTKKISILGGFSTDYSAVPQGALGNDPLHFFSHSTSNVSTSFGVGSHGEGGDLLLGGELGYGWGDRLAVNPYVLPARLEPTSEHVYSLLIVLAGSTSFRAIRRAVSDIAGTAPPPKDKPTLPEKMKTDAQTEEVVEEKTVVQEKAK